MGLLRRRRGGLSGFGLARGGGAPFVGAYDAFTASLAHVYEPARRVLTAYTGNLVRLRRASDDAEANFTFTADGNLDTVAIAAWAGGASYVVTVYDQTTNADNITQADSARQPLFVASAKNGHAGMLLDGTGDYLAGAFTTGGALSQPFNIFSVAQLDATAVDDGSYRHLSDSTSSQRMILRQSRDQTPDAWATYAGVALVDGSSDANWNLWAALFAGASSQCWLNAISVASGDAGISSPPGLTIGAQNGGAAGFWKGYVLNNIICDPSLSNADRILMQTAINSYWAVY